MMSKGTILRFGATLHAKPEFITEKGLKSFAEDIIYRLKLGLRRFTVEKYGNPKGAMTIIGFLNESHIELTTYPEDELVELEVCSCKKVPITDLVSWLMSMPETFKVEMMFILDKEDGRWIKGF